MKLLWNRPTFVVMSWNEYKCTRRLLPVLRMLLFWWMPVWRPVR